MRFECVFSFSLRHRWRAVTEPNDRCDSHETLTDSFSAVQDVTLVCTSMTNTEVKFCYIISGKIYFIIDCMDKNMRLGQLEVIVIIGVSGCGGVRRCARSVAATATAAA